MNKLAIYLKQVREKLRLSTRDVAEAAKRKYPHNKQRQISFPYLNRMESGKVKEFSPLKLKTLAEIYDENYLYLLYLAGILPEHITLDTRLTEIEKFVYDELLESGLLRSVAKSKSLSKIDPKTRNAMRLSIRAAAKAVLEAILNSE
jgi:transcriptional regulator with XRE-family HTH domain